MPHRGVGGDFDQGLHLPPSDDDAPCHTCHTLLLLQRGSLGCRWLAYKGLTRLHRGNLNRWDNWQIVSSDRPGKWASDTNPLDQAGSQADSPYSHSTVALCSHPSAVAFPIMRNSICHFDYDIVML